MTFRPRGTPLYEIIPEEGAYTFSVASPANTPPVWNVRIVSCVPGSPMDCAASTPTASPNWTSLYLDKSHP